MSETLKQAPDILMANQSESDDNPMRGRNLHTDAVLDRIADLEAQLAEARERITGLEAAAQDWCRAEWKTRVGNPFFEAAKAAADERMAALKHESRGHLMRAEAAERALAETRAALQEIADCDVRYPPHDPGNYMPPKGNDGPCRKIALAALSRASDSSPQRG